MCVSEAALCACLRLICVRRWAWSVCVADFGLCAPLSWFCVYVRGWVGSACVAEFCPCARLRSICVQGWVVYRINRVQCRSNAHEAGGQISGSDFPGLMGSCSISQCRIAFQEETCSSLFVPRQCLYPPFWTQSPGRPIISSIDQIHKVRSA